MHDINVERGAQLTVRYLLRLVMRLLIFVSCTALLVFLPSLGAEAAAPAGTINVTLSPENSGSVATSPVQAAASPSSSPCATSCTWFYNGPISVAAAPGPVTLTETPDAGYEFVAWTVTTGGKASAPCGTAPTCTVTFTYGTDGFANVTATFATVPATTTTTSTTTTQPPVTTVPASTTTTSKPKGTTVTTAPKASTTTTSSSTTTTTAPKTTTTTTTASTPTGSDGLELGALSVSPGSNVSATGHGCSANAPVDLTVDSNTIGHAKASSQGEFDASLQTASLAVGQYQVLAHCGPVLAASFNVVLVSQVSQDGSTVVIIFFVILLGLVIFRRRSFGGRKKEA